MVVAAGPVMMPHVATLDDWLRLRRRWWWAEGRARSDDANNGDDASDVANDDNNQDNSPVDTALFVDWNADVAIIDG